MFRFLDTIKRLNFSKEHNSHKTTANIKDKSRVATFTYLFDVAALAISPAFNLEGYFVYEK